MTALTIVWVEEYEMIERKGWRIGINGVCLCDPQPTVLDAIKYALDHVPPDWTAGVRPDEETMNALAQLIQAYGGLVRSSTTP